MELSFLFIQNVNENMHQMYFCTVFQIFVTNIMQFFLVVIVLQRFILFYFNFCKKDMHVFFGGLVWKFFEKVETKTRMNTFET